METAQAVGIVLGVTVSVLGILGAFYKFVLVPNLQRDLVGPMRKTQTLAEETHREVKQNGHQDPGNPTLKDSLKDLAGAVDALALRIEGTDRKLEDHILVGTNAMRRMERKVDEIGGASS